MAASALACKYAVPVFSLAGSDGETYTAKSFMARPTIIVFIHYGCPGSYDLVKSFNSLQSQLKGQANVVAFAKISPEKAVTYAKEIKATFPIIADPSGKTIAGFGAKNGGNLTFVALSEEARFPKIWDGYSKPILKEVLDSIRKHGKTLPIVSLAAVPNEKTSGCKL